MARFIKWNFWRALLFASVLCLAVIMVHQSQVAAAPLAASQGPRFAGTATSATWSNPSNATGANDNVCATGNVGSTSIDLTNFSFNIPAGSTITGILVEPKIAYDEIMNTQLLKAGAPVGSVKQIPIGVTLTCAPTAFSSLGGAGDLWGTTWTPSDINANNFGWRTSAGGGSIANLDAVRITVFYDPPPAPPVTASSSAPKEVPEGDTLLLLGGGIGGLGVWLRWQWSKRKRVTG